MRIELNLRLPSMLAGRKGFERIRWAFKNVLNDSVTWLFRDCESSKPQPQAASELRDSKPIAKLHPILRSAHPPVQVDLEGTLVPDLSAPPRHPERLSEHLRSDTCWDVLEWLSLVVLQSPRINAADEIDSYLCRYALSPSTLTSSSGTAATTVTTLRWHGFIPAKWLCRVTAACASLLQMRTEAWLAISAKAMKIEEGNERHDGWCLLYPVVSHESTTMENGKDADGDAGMAVSEGGTGGHQTASSGTNRVLRRERDFVLWDLVDCVSER